MEQRIEKSIRRTANGLQIFIFGYFFNFVSKSDWTFLTLPVAVDFGLR
jgi:hypothetical protein